MEAESTFQFLNIAVNKEAINWNEVQDVGIARKETEVEVHLASLTAKR